MIKIEEIKAGGKTLEALETKLGEKNLILLKGSKGYIMCGYLNLEVAEKFGDVAIKITGISTIDDALKTQVHSCTSRAKNLGIKEGQSIKEVISIIA